MRFYVIFTLIFMFMLTVTLIQVRRQEGLSRRSSCWLFGAGLLISMLLAILKLLIFE